MGNVLDYVRREFRGFAELPFGDVDSLVLSELSYMRLTDLVPTFGEAKSVATVPIRELLRAESYDEMFVSNSSDMNDYRLALLRAVCESPRFRALRVGEYAERLSERDQQQFAAMTFDVGCGSPDLLYIAFRGAHDYGSHGLKCLMGLRPAGNPNPAMLRGAGRGTRAGRDPERLETGQGTFSCT